MQMLLLSLSVVVKQRLLNTIRYLLCDLLDVFNVIDWKTLNLNGKINLSVLTGYFAILIQLKYAYSTLYT